MTNLCMVVHNRPRLTEQAIMSLGDIDNVTILDDCSDRDTYRLLDWRAADPHISVLHTCQIVGTGYARNLCIAASRILYGRGDYLCLTDNDLFYLRPDWLSLMIACYEDARRVGFSIIGCYNHPFHQTDASIDAGDREVKEVIALSSQSMLMRWDVWEKFGPFVKTAPKEGCQSEDIELTNRVRAEGGRLGVVSPALMVNTGLTNSAGKKIPGWELVKAACPPGVICE